MTVPFAFLASYVDEMPIHLNAVSEIGYFFWFYAGFGLLVRVGFRELPDRIGPERVLKLGLLTTGAGLLLFLLVTPEAPWRLALPAALTGLGHGLTFHTMTSMTIAPFPPALRGSASATRAHVA
jgi:MFS family permease